MEQELNTEWMEERYELAVGRLTEIVREQNLYAELTKEAYVATICEKALLLGELVHEDRKTLLMERTLEEWKECQNAYYDIVLPKAYETSFANPTVSVRVFGVELGQLLCYLLTETINLIPTAVKGDLEQIVMQMELVLEIVSMLQDEETTWEHIKNTIYYFEHDYSELIVEKRVAALLDDTDRFAFDIIMKSDLEDLRYLFAYGDYITENEIGMAAYFNKLDEEKIDALAGTYTQGYEEGFRLAGIDLSKKRTVNIRYGIGQERMIRAAITQFAKMGLEPIIFGVPGRRINKKGQIRSGYLATSVNRQFEFDHRMDEGIFLDKNLVERKLEVLKQAYEKRKELAKDYAGPAVVETFGEIPFQPVAKDASVKLTEKQQELSVEYTTQSSAIVNEYIRRDQYSFTIIAYPVPEIGEQFEEIFDEIVKVNTLDKRLYREIQQTLIQELDQAVSVRILGKDDNETNLTVQMREGTNIEKETNFENCLADVNIPVGEVFTSPKLSGTNGVLFVSEVFLNDLLYKNLRISFEDGMVKDYTCSNFASEDKNKSYIRENVLFNHETLPIGEFAIGTNTTAYVMAHKYDIVYKLPILIAEKMGPHFAVGDTCYSHSEENRVYNPDGREIVAKDNECSLLRKSNPDKAYFNCHTDITIPYRELGAIVSVHADGTEVELIRDGRFVLPGTEQLNAPFDGEELS